MPSLRPPHPTRHIVAVLRDDFVSGRFFPDQPLSILELSVRFRLSTTPVREALARLIGEGLVVIAAGGGHAVASLEPGELSRLRRLERMLLTSLLWGGDQACDLGARLAARAAPGDAVANQTQWLFGEMARAAGDGVLLEALQRIGARLGVVRRHEASDAEELTKMAAAFAQGGEAWRDASALYFSIRAGREAQTLDRIRNCEAERQEH